MTKKNYYAVHTGRTTGIYTTWPEAKEQVDKYPRARYKGFATYRGAEDFMKHGEYDSSHAQPTSHRQNAIQHGRDNQCHRYSYSSDHHIGDTEHHHRGYGYKEVNVHDDAIRSGSFNHYSQRDKHSELTISTRNKQEHNNKYGYAYNASSTSITATTTAATTTAARLHPEYTGDDHGADYMLNH